MKNKVISLYMSLIMSVIPLWGNTTPDNPAINKGVAQKLEEISSSSEEKIFLLQSEVCTEKDSMTTMEKEDNIGSPYYGLYEGVSHGNWAEVPELINFVNSKNDLYLAYANDSFIYIEKMQDNLCKSNTIKIVKKFPLLGDVICDDNDNIYVIWGQEDKEGKGDCVTMAVSKYTSKGAHIKTVEYRTNSSSNYFYYMQTKKPFSSGSCDTLINNGVLITNFARLMYNGHQSNAILAVNINDMTKNTKYSNYVSHSFDQRVLVTATGEIIFANQGDAYPRGFTVGKETETYFHFYGALGNNYTYAQLGDLCDIKGTVIYSGVSASSLDQNAKTEPTNLFIQIADTEKSFKGSSIRKGTSASVSVEDKGVLWITNYKNNEDAKNPQMVKISNSRFILLWEKFINERYVETFYVVMDSSGKQISQVTSLEKQRLNTFEPPVLKGKKLVWVTAGRYEYSYNKNDNTCYYGYKIVDGNKAVFHSVDMTRFIGSDEIIKEATITLTPMPNINNSNVLEKGETFETSKYSYKVTSAKNKYVEIIGAKSKKITSLKINSTVTYKGITYKIVSVGSKSFRNYKKLKTVTIGKNVKTIGSHAFSGCSKLGRVIIGKNTRTIGNYAFNKDKSLKMIEIKSSKLKTIGKSSFKSTGTSITIKVPKSKIKEYRKLFKNKGLSKKTKIIT